MRAISKLLPIIKERQSLARPREKAESSQATIYAKVLKIASTLLRREDSNDDLDRATGEIITSPYAGGVLRVCATAIKGDYRRNRQGIPNKIERFAKLPSLKSISVCYFMRRQ